ncbi:MAG: hypothetical protein M1838_001770 [Thelocarpon superellum]|nr:MAG: hypothetical protein M1838_001770 [Thelocarpon superellum]
MANLDHLNAALGSARNEDTLALANLHFDFSLFRVDAPQEFSGLGVTLSSQRRLDAETGTPHQTARGLGALFEQLLPGTPALVKAYGRRVSAISESPTVEPKASTRDGVFSTQVGADGTGIWAAATSGSGAIAVHLLACMLARIWSAPKAISVWVEMVAERKKEISANCDGSQSVHYTALMAAQQEISRKQLAEWDANARAWLRSADEAMKMQQTQLMLIIKNVNISVNKIMNTYQMAAATSTRKRFRTFGV